jgi:hypothetical protein
MDRSQHLSNKGQLTIFMVMAVVLLFVCAFVFMLYSRNAIHLDFTAPSIQEYLNNCLRQTSEEGLELLGKQGGRIQLQDYVSAPQYGITYWLKGKTLSVPSIADMESQLLWYLGNNIDRCINDFEDFEDKGWQVDSGEFSALVSINQNEISIVAAGEHTLNQQTYRLITS